MKKFLLLFLSALAFVSCDEGDALATDKTAEGPKIVGFKSASSNIAYFEDLGVKDHSFPVNLIGLGNGLLSTTDIAVPYEIDLANSTATEGVEFDFTDSSGTIRIPAGTDFGTFNLKVNTGQLNASAKTELVIILKPTVGVTVGEKQKTLKIIFVGCSTALEGSYVASNGRPATVTKIAPNLYRSSYLPNFAATYWFEFSDVCGDLEIYNWQFNGSNPLTATGGGNVTGYVNGAGGLVFEHANVAGVPWYVDLTFSLN